MKVGKERDKKVREIKKKIRAAMESAKSPAQALWLADQIDEAVAALRALEDEDRDPTC